MLGQMWSTIFEEIVPFPAYFRNISRLRRLVRADDLFHQRPRFAKYPSLAPEQLLERLKEEQVRATALDEKTFKMTLSLTVGLTVIGTTSAVLVGAVGSIIFKAILETTIWLAIGFILGAGLIALGALKTQTSFGYGTDRLLVEQEERSSVYADNLARQEMMNQIRHVRNEAAYQSLRNGFVLLFLALAMLAGAKLSGQAPNTILPPVQVKTCAPNNNPEFSA